MKNPATEVSKIFLCLAALTLPACSTIDPKLDPGWQEFSTPRSFDGVGSVVEVTDGIWQKRAVLKHETAKTCIGTQPKTTGVEARQFSFDAILRLLAIQGVGANAQANVKQTYSLEYTYGDACRREILIDQDQTFKSSFAKWNLESSKENRQYYIITGTDSVSLVKYRVSENFLSNLSSEADWKKTVSGSATLKFSDDSLRNIDRDLKVDCKSKPDSCYNVRYFAHRLEQNGASATGQSIYKIASGAEVSIPGDDFNSNRN